MQTKFNQKISKPKGNKTSSKILKSGLELVNSTTNLHNLLQTVEYAKYTSTIVFSTPKSLESTPMSSKSDFDPSINYQNYLSRQIPTNQL